MYSTPGISKSSFSMGLVTRSSTSCAEAPGICTNTSIIGTMICGSSSRGSFHTAKAPIAARHKSKEASIWRRSTRERRAPRDPGGGPRSLPDLYGGAVLQPHGQGQHHLFARVQAGENFDRILVAPYRGDQPGVCRAIFHHEYRLQLAALHQGGQRSE